MKCLNYDNNMNHNYINGLSAEERLYYFSYLQSLKENSAFIQRLYICQSYSYLTLKSNRDYSDRLQHVITNGVIEVEEPQTNLFVETVLTPFGSFRVFPGCFEYDRYNLSLLLFLAKTSNVPKEKLSVVYFFLELSDIIARRKGYGYWVVGCPNQEIVSIPLLNSGQICNCDVVLSADDIKNAAAKHNLNYDALKQIIIDADLSDVEEEFAAMMYSETLEAHPIYKTNDGKYVILFLSSLLHCAYSQCYNILITLLGKESLYEKFGNILSNEAFLIIQKAYGKCIHRGVIDGIEYATFRFDEDKFANVVVCLIEDNGNVRKVQNILNEKCKAECSARDIMPIVIWDNLDNRERPIQAMPESVVFSLPGLEIAMDQDDFTMADLYYFWLCKRKIDFSSSEDLDVLAYYLSNKRSFYDGQQADMRYIGAGVSLDIKSRYYTKHNMHSVLFDLCDANVIISHFDEIPTDVPIYKMTVNGKSEFYLNELKNGRYASICQSINGIQENSLSIEITKSILIWMHAIEKRFAIDVLLKNVHIELVLLEQEEFDMELYDENWIVYCVPLNILETGKKIHFEEMILTYLLRFLSVKKFMNPVIGPQHLSCMFHESQGRFILLNEHSDDIAYNDGVTDCYFVKESLCDIILDEVASFVNKKGYERRLDVNESKQVVIDVINHLRSEAEKLIRNIDTKRLLKSLLELHHAMVFWTHTTKSRFEMLSKAYQYIGSSFANQDSYLNQYAEINILTQGVIEYVILNDIHVESSRFILSDVERLFALMHEINNFSTYLDQVSAGVKNCELTILSNGRLYVPDGLIQATNSYFYKLRDIELNRPDLYRYFLNLFPNYKIDTESDAFQSAYCANYGISYKDYKELFHRAIGYAVENGSPVTVIDECLFRKQIASHLCEEEYDSFVNSFVLKAELKNEGLKDSECWLQRFNRKVQLTVRPWVYYDHQYYYSTKTLYESVSIQMERIENASIRAVSKEMESYLGEIKLIKGKLFTCKIREYFEHIGRIGMYVNSEVKIEPCSKLNSDKDYGDIDVLLIDRTTKKIVCIEAKNYVESKTVYELITQNRKIEKDLSKVVERNKWCKDNLLSFKTLDDYVDADYSIQTVFLTLNECAYPYFEHDEMTDITFLSALDIIEDPLIVFL